MMVVAWPMAASADSTAAMIALRYIEAPWVNQLSRPYKARVRTIPARMFGTLLCSAVHGIVAQQGAGDDGGGVDEPEAEDRLQRETPVGEAPLLGKFITHGSHLGSPPSPLQSAPCRLAEAQPPPVEQSTVLSRNGPRGPSLRLTTYQRSESAMTEDVKDKHRRGRTASRRWSSRRRPSASLNSSSRNTRKTLMQKPMLAPTSPWTRPIPAPRPSPAAMSRRRRPAFPEK